jgi:hypothetical protein
MEFDYFFFKPIPYEMVAWKLEGRLGKNLTRDVYGKWVNWYLRHSRLFYPHQYSYHSEIVFNRFISENDLSPYEEGWYESDTERYEEYRIKNGLNKHYKECNQFLETVSNQLRKYVVSESIEISEITARITKELLSSESSPRAYIGDVVRLWFNNLIDNSVKDEEALRNMSYADYLKSRHWRQVKALKVKIHRARCSNPKCEHFREGFWGSWVSEVQCHHATYKNRGNERYDEIYLLCKPCHAQAHKGEASEVISHLNNFVIF